MKKAVVGIKKIIKRITFIAGIMTALLFSACKDGFEILPEQPEMAKVTITVTNNGGRTVLPVLPEKIKYELWGGFTETEEETLLAEFSSNNTSVYLEPGNWSFTLYAYDGDNVILQGKLSNQQIPAKDNTLTFYLFPLNSDSGAIRIIFTFPKNSGITRVTTDTGETKGLNEKDFTINNGQTKFLYSENNVPAGDHFIKFKFFNGNNEQIRKVSELILVRKNLTSTKEIELQGFTEDVPGNTLKEQLDWLKNYAKDGGEYTVTVTGTEYIDPSDEKQWNWLGYGPDNNYSVTITLTGGGTVRLNNRGKMFQVWHPVTLILDDVTLIGISYNWMPLILLDGALIMNEKAVIKDNTNDESNPDQIGGGGVSVSKGAQFTMNGGTISGNKSGCGGGVSIWNGTFTMNSGKISGNTAENGGGVRVDDGGTFTMSDGEISGNNASYGGGVFVSIGTFNMNGGKIIDENNAEYGGGVYVYSNGIFTMSGGEVSSNNASSDGGGVYVLYSGTFTMSGGVISGNNASYGGGVCVNAEGTFTMSDGVISGNNASYGGGVCVNAEGTFTMSGRVISGNTAQNYGGGVYVQNGGAFTKASTGGTIYGYTAENSNRNAVIDSSGRVQNNYGHAVYVNNDNRRRDDTVLSSEMLSYNGGNGETFTGTWYEKPTPITISAIEGVAPKIGETPVTAIAENEQYSGTVTWLGNPSTFAASTPYTAIITLAANIGYTLQDVAANFFTVAGAASVSGEWDANGNYGTITAEFPPIINTTLKVTFTGITERIITINQHISEGGLSRSGEGSSITLTIEETFTKYVWYIGETKFPESAKSVTLPASAFTVGINWITVVVYDNKGTPWSGDIVVTVKE